MSFFGRLFAAMYTSFAPDPSGRPTGISSPLRQDADGRLEGHSAVYSDEGSFRDDFSGSSLTTALSGTLTFTASSTSVTGAATSFLTQVQQHQWIKKTADSETLYVQVDEVLSDTTLTLVSAYGGTTSTTTGVVSNWQTVTAAAGGSITVANSGVALVVGTTSGQSTYIHQTGDYLPYTSQFRVTAAQRIANQEIRFGFANAWANPTKRAWVVLSGVDSTQVTFKVGSSTAAADLESTTATLPDESTTLVPHDYRIELSHHQASLVVDGVTLITHKVHLPGPYDVLDVYVGVANTGTTGAPTTLLVDVADFYNNDRLQVDNDYHADPLEGDAMTRQAVVADPVNVSTANLAVGATWTGIWTSRLGVAGYQVTLYSDQNCTLYIDQVARIGWQPVTDEYDYNALKGAFSVTIQTVSNLIRLRVKNVGSNTTTTLQVAGTLCPTVEALPRSLDENGYLKTAVYELTDEFGYKIKSDPMGALRTEQPYRLVGAAFTNTGLDANYWLNSSNGTGAAVTPGNGLVTLTSTSTGPGYAELITSKTARFVFAHPHLYRGILRKPNLVVPNTECAWGAYTVARTTIAAGSNGASLPQATINVASTAVNLTTGSVAFPSSGTIYVTTAAGVQTVTYTGVTGTSFTGCSGGTGAMATGGLVQFVRPVDGFYFSYSAAGVLSVRTTNQGVVTWSAASGTFNGDVSTYILNTDMHAFEILHFLGSAKFLIDNVAIHTFAPTTVPMTSTCSLPTTVTVTNLSAGGAQTQTQLEVWASMILRLGRDMTAPVWRYIRGVNAGVTLKNGPGRLKSVTVNGSATGSAVSLYDATSATNPIALIAITANNMQPFTMTYDVDFNVGLFVVTAVATTDVTIIYE